jgi:hypothetical protein
MKYIDKVICTAVLFIVFSSCEKEKTQLTIPTNYVSANYTTNVATEASVRAQMSALTTYMKNGENVANKLSIDSLTKYYTSNGTPSLSALTQPYYKNLINTNWLNTMVACSQNAYDPTNGATAIIGGVYGARLLDDKGKENLQEIEKGLFEAVMYNHFLTLTQGAITPETVDKMISIYGAHPNFPNTNTATKTTTPDGFMALYAARRDKNDGNGFYTKIRDQFLKLQSAVAAGEKYNAERDEAIATIKLNIEKAIMATVIHYGYTSTTKLTTTSPPATTISGGLHDLSEGVGFTHGFKTIPAGQRKITDAQIDEILVLLLAPANSNGSMYQFVTNGIVELPKIAQAQQKIKAIYGFTDLEMDEFKNNWISVQGR